jgi:anti-anti-sigma regulatory factor
MRETLPIVVGAVAVEHLSPAHLRLVGRITTDREEAALREYACEMHERAVAEKLASLTIDVTELVFVNSSAIRVFVDLASRAEKAGYGLVFDIDSSVPWHRLSFAALQALSPRIVVNLAPKPRVSTRA